MQQSEDDRTAMRLWCEVRRTRPLGSIQAFVYMRGKRSLYSGMLVEVEVDVGRALQYLAAADAGRA